MANLFCELNAQAIALVAATPKTVAMVTAPTNQVLRIKGISICLDGANSAATPITIEYGRPSTAGTFTSTTPLKKDTGRGETVQTTGGTNASSEPTWTSVVLGSRYLGAFNGLYHWILPADNPIIVPGGGRFGIRLTAAANVNSCTVIDFEE